MDYESLPEDSVLCSESDEQLIKGLEKYAELAGISGNKEYIWESVKDNQFVTKRDEDIVSTLMPFKSKVKKTGAMYIGQPLSGLTKKFMALTGLFVRNYIDARYTTIDTLLDNLEEGYEYNCTVIFIPNFHPKIKANDKKQYPLPSWKRGKLLSFLLDCQSKNIDVVAGIYSLKALEDYMGQEISDYVKSNFMKLEAIADE